MSILDLSLFLEDGMMKTICFKILQIIETVTILQIAKMYIDLLFSFFLIREHKGCQISSDSLSKTPYFHPLN